jgi:hypothetical protein
LKKGDVVFTNGCSNKTLKQFDDEKSIFELALFPKNNLQLLPFL